MRTKRKAAEKKLKVVVAQKDILQHRLTAAVDKIGDASNQLAELQLQHQTEEVSDHQMHR